VAAWILEELASERRWQEAFARSADVLERLADEALAEHCAIRSASGDAPEGLPTLRPCEQQS
jgi:hypothetical protein